MARPLPYCQDMAEQRKPHPDRRNPTLRCPKCEKAFVKKEMTIAGQSITSAFRCAVCGEIWPERRLKNGE